MLGVYVTVPIACFRKGLAREYLETEPIPPPATCYGFLLSLVGETDRHRHIGCRVTPVLLNKPQMSVVLRTVWRVKNRPLGSSGNTRPDYQQLLSGPSAIDPFISLLIWLDSTLERGEGPGLEIRVKNAMIKPASIFRFGGLSLGESTHLIDEVSLWDRVKDRHSTRTARAFLVSSRGRLTLPVWVDHVGSAGTRYATGNLEESPLSVPPADKLPVISPE
jgi:CRISPR-associated protein Cas5t